MNSQDLIKKAEQIDEQIAHAVRGIIAMIAIVAGMWVWHSIDEAEPAMKAGLENAHMSIQGFQSDMDNTCAGSTSAFCRGWNSEPH
jgi:hypothetical protein